MKTSLTIILFAFSQIIFAQKTANFNLKNGDLLFQDIDCGELCDAIEKVTPAYKDKHFSHIGLVMLKNDSVWVIEAIGANVHLTNLNDFLIRQKDLKGNPKVVVGRLQPQYEKLNELAISFATKQIGVPYDDIFLLNNSKYYCSELIYDAYKFANNGNDFFQLFSMTFKDPKTRKTFPAWKDYYHQLMKKIPEGKLGCNPGSIANDIHLQIVFSYY